MKKILANIFGIGAAILFISAGAVDAQSAPPRHDSSNHNMRPNRPPPPSVHHRPGHGVRYSYLYRPYGYYAGYYPYRYGYYGWPYYTTGYLPYYGYAYPGISVNYTTYADSDAPGYTLGGAVLGGVLGGIIGNNSGRGNAWAGAAIGSTIGLLAGNAADRAAVRQERADWDAAQMADNHAEIARATHVAQPKTPAPQQPQRVHTPAPATPMSEANALFGRQ